MKYLTSICICLLFSTSAFAQQEPEIAPPQEPSNSVIDKDLTVDAEQEVGSVVPQTTDNPTIVDPSVVDQNLVAPAIGGHQVAPIQTMIPHQPGCGCQQTNYQSAMPMIGQPYSNQVYSGNTFVRAPMRGQQIYQTYSVPQPRAYTSTPVQQNWQYGQRYGQQYYYAPQPMLPVRRGLLFNRFRW